MNIKAKIILAAALLLLLPKPAPADGLSLDIKEAIELTLANNAELLSLRQEAVKARAFKIQADGTLTPEVGVSAYADVQREIQTNDGTYRDDSSGVTASLAQTIYSGGRDAALRRQSPQVRTIAELALADGENRAAGELFARFYNVLLQEHRVMTEEAAIRTSELHLREVTRMSELGLANRLEVIRADQQLAANRADLSAARGLYRSAQISLMNYIAIPPSGMRPVKGDLRSLSAEGGRDSSLALAMRSRADLARLEQQLGYQKNQIEIERAGLRPKAVIGAQAGYLDPYRGSDRGEDTWRAELTITVPILDRGSARGNILREQAVLEQDKIAFTQKELDIRSGVETAWTELEATLERLGSTERALLLAEETLRLAEVGYQEGVTPQLDLLAAQSSLTDSRLAHLSAIYNNMLAVVALKVTEGDILSWAKGREF